MEAGNAAGGLAFEDKEDTSADIAASCTEVVDGRLGEVGMPYMLLKNAYSADLLDRKNHAAAAAEAWAAADHVALRADDGSSFPGTIQPQVASIGAMREIRRGYQITDGLGLLCSHSAS